MSETVRTLEYSSDDSAVKTSTKPLTPLIAGRNASMPISSYAEDAQDAVKMVGKMMKDDPKLQIPY